MGDPQSTTGKSSCHSQKSFKGREPPTAVHDNTGGIGIVKVAIITSL